MNRIPKLLPRDTTPGGGIVGKWQLLGKAPAFVPTLLLPLCPSPPLGSSACLASLRRAAAKLEEGAAWTDKVLLAAGLPLGTMEPFRGDGVRGLTVAVVRVAVESIPRDGDFGSWLMPVDETHRVRHVETGSSIFPQCLSSGCTLLKCTPGSGSGGKHIPASH